VDAMRLRSLGRSSTVWVDIRRDPRTDLVKKDDRSRKMYLVFLWAADGGDCSVLILYATRRPPKPIRYCDNKIERAIGIAHVF
jgi:hypothetical protein